MLSLIYRPTGHTVCELGTYHCRRLCVTSCGPVLHPGLNFLSLKWKHQNPSPLRRMVVHIPYGLFGIYFLGAYYVPVGGGAASKQTDCVCGGERWLEAGIVT